MEQLLHYVWKHRLFETNLKTSDGTLVEVLDVGLHNTDEGPDFFNAKIKLGDKVWAGNIEIHTKSSDWTKHGHHKNKNYNSVILHIVDKIDQKILNEADQEILQCEISYPSQIKENIEFLLRSDISLPCCNYLKDLNPVYIENWLGFLLFERLERKSEDIKKLLERFNNSWAEVFYVLLSRSMGFGLNSDAFQQLALSLPLNHILKQGDNLFQIEALLLGQSGLLSEVDSVDEYTSKLKDEYNFLRNKYSLQPLDSHLFRMMRTRPSGLPYVRMAQLAVLLKNIQGLYSKVMSSKDLGQIRLLFHVNTSEYWQTHYVLGELSPYKQKYIGDSSLDIMIINAVIPLMFAHGRKINEEAYINKGLAYLDEIKAERNSIVTQFGNYGVVAKSAYYSQALVQLKREYCDKKKCLYCRIGYKVLSGK